jgi:hypothetical protein
MSRRIDIELTSTREDGSWTWRAAGAREPRGTIEGDILPSGAEVGSVLRAEVEGFLDGLSVVAVLPPRAPRSEPERLELKSARADQPLVTSTLAPKRPGERGRRNDRGRDGRDRREGREGGEGRREGRDGGEGRREGRDGGEGRREGRDGGEGRRERRGPRDRDRDRDRDRSAARHERPARPAPPPVEAKPKPKRLRPGKAHRTALLEAVPAEQRPIAEQLLVGGIPSVRQAIDKQNAELKAEGKPEVKPDALLRVAEELRPKALAAVWRDRAEAAAAVIDDLDLRDLRSVVNAAGDAGRDEEARALAAKLREALTVRVEKEQADWLAELAETVKAGRVVRALRLSSRPPKAGAPIPGDIATQLAEATAASLTDQTGPERWATVLDALAYSPVRRRVIPQSLPAKLSPELRATIARLASRLPDIAHIFDIEPDPAAERAARGQARRRPGDRKDGGRKDGGRKGGDGARKGDRPRKPKSDAKPGPKADEGSTTGKPAAGSDDKPAAKGAPVADEAPKSEETAAVEAEAVPETTGSEETGAVEETPEVEETAAVEAEAVPETTGSEEPGAVDETPTVEATAAVEAEAVPETTGSEETGAVDETPTVEATAAVADVPAAEETGNVGDTAGGGADEQAADEPTATNGSAAIGGTPEDAGTGETDAGETGIGEPATGEPAAEAQPQS